MRKKSPPPRSILPLTAKEKAVLEFIENQLRRSGISPSYQEIKDHFGLASYNSIQNYLKQLKEKSYIDFSPNQKRAIQILNPSNSVQNSIASSSSAATGSGSPLLGINGTLILKLPLLGGVAAGKPIESNFSNEFIEVSSSMVKKPQSTYALKVNGNSMIDDGIFNNDLILVQSQKMAENGSLIVATIEDEATVKRFYLKNTQVELRPSNLSMSSMWYPAEEVKIQGIVVGLIRRYN